MELGPVSSVASANPTELNEAVSLTASAILPEGEEDLNARSRNKSFQSDSGLTASHHLMPPVAPALEEVESALPQNAPDGLETTVPASQPNGLTPPEQSSLDGCAETTGDKPRIHLSEYSGPWNIERIVEVEPGWTKYCQSESIYYVEVGNKRAMSWPRLESDTSETNVMPYLGEVIRLAEELKVPWPAQEVEGSMSTTAYVSGAHQTASIGETLKLLDDAKEQHSLCIIENITPEWIEALGSYYGIDPEFFVSHIANEKLPVPMTDHARQRRYTTLLEESGEYLSRSEALLMRLESHRHFTTSMGKIEPADLLSGIHVLHSVLDRVKVLVEMHRPRTSENGEPSRETFLMEVRRLSRHCAVLADWMCGRIPLEQELLELVSRIGMIERDFNAMEKWWSQYRYYSLSAVTDYQNSRVPELGRYREATCYFSRHFLPSYGNKFARFLAKLSYVRVHRNLCIVLVDRSFPAFGLSFHVTRKCRSWAYLGSWKRPREVVLPHQVRGGIFVDYFDLLRRFAYHRWHATALCSGSSSTDGRYAAIMPSPFIWLLSSSLWEGNLRYLERWAREVSFNKIRSADSTMNDELHDLRSEVALLMHRLSSAQTVIPAAALKVFDQQLNIRKQTDHALYSPLENHKDMLVRAKALEDLLMTSFQLLMSTLSVRDSQESIKQTRRATLITILAFVYIPLSLVTGIFGMNLTQAPNGFQWWAPLVALVAVGVFTALLFGVAYLLGRHLLEKREPWKAGKDV